MMSINDSRQISIQLKEHGCYDQYIMSTTKCTIVYNTCTSTYLLCRYLRRLTEEQRNLPQ